MITHHHRNLLAAVLLLIIGGLLMAAAAPTSPAKTAAEMRGLTFNHALHESQGLDCDACHSAATSTSGTDDLLPKHPQCSDCHDVEEAAGCTMCHLNASPALSPRVTDYSPKFDHKRHIEAGKQTCAACHANLDAPLTEGKTGHLPAMAECMDCHTTDRVKNECLTCHSAKEDLVPANHKLEWINAHGIAATTESECAMCHKTDDCQKCHNGDQVFMPHPRNYIARHGQDAHLADISCSVCHDERDFCTSCHRQMNVLPADHFKPGWATMSGGDHADQARFDLDNCLACHDTPGQQPVCARCHTK
ncbi:MAG: cytochrome c3 family protein [Calditrichota bacterium]